MGGGGQGSGWTGGAGRGKAAVLVGLAAAAGAGDAVVPETTRSIAIANARAPATTDIVAPQIAALCSRPGQRPPGGRGGSARFLVGPLYCSRGK